ncbi:hypothetical protein D3C86_1536660 [compost metagenome]
MRRCIAGIRRVLQFQTVLGLEFFDLPQQLIESIARRRVEKTLPQRGRAHRPAFTQNLSDARRDAGYQFTELANVTLVVEAQAGLTGNELTEKLGIAHQLACQRTFALQGFFRLLCLERGDHFIALAIEHRDLLRFAAHRRQPLQTRQHALFQAVDLRLDIRGLTGLAEGNVDLHQIVQGFQIASQRQAAAQQVEALQFNPGALEFAIGITHQIEVGHQHWHQEQNADQAELHAEAQAIH